MTSESIASWNPVAECLGAVDKLRSAGFEATGRFLDPPLPLGRRLTDMSFKSILVTAMPEWDPGGRSGV